MTAGRPNGDRWNFTAPARPGKRIAFHGMVRAASGYLPAELPTSTRFCERHKVRASFSFSVAEASFRVVSGESFSNVSWTDAMKVSEDRKRFLIFFNRFNICVIPKSAFTEPASISRLREDLLARLGTRANLRD